MRFIRRNLVFLSILAVLILSCVLVLHQISSNQSAHADLREDFILLYERNETKATERLYQFLIQQLPNVSTHTLVEDLQRTSMLVDAQSDNVDNLLWKFQISVKNELQKRSKQRVERALERAENS
jgi:hypothetical protein